MYGRMSGVAVSNKRAASLTVRVPIFVCGSFAFAVFSAGLLPLRHRKAWIVLQLGLRTLAQAAFKTDSG